MRGGFVACLGGDGQALDRVVECMRWHRGKPLRDQRDGLEIAAFVDGVEGPALETRDGVTRVVHGGDAAPLAELQRRRSRFAAVEWDRRRLRASRDPIGLAPLFYRVFRGAIWLATEVRPLAALGALAPDLDAVAAQAAFVPMDERTGWQSIHRVLAGSTLEIGPDLRATSAHYWRPAELIGRYRGSRAEALAEFGERMRTAITRCYQPGSGILLSGGLDSAVIAVSAASRGGERPYLVHVHYPDIPKTHEEHYAGTVAAKAGAELHVVPGDVSAWDIGRELEGWGGVPYSWLPYGMEEPALARMAADGVTVVLDGHDGDGVLGPAGSVWGGLILEGEWRRVGELAARYGVRPFLRGTLADLLPPHRWIRWLAGLPPKRTYMQMVARYIGEPLHPKLQAADIDRWTWAPRRWRVRQLRPLIPGATISFEQKELEAARHGLDMRHPFADRDLVELLISLPLATKSDPMRSKALLLDSLGDLLPDELHERRKSDYMAAVRRRVDAARCVEDIRGSGVRLPQFDYERIFADVRSDPDRVPLFMLVNLARVHRFAQLAGAATGPL